jgi:hypothetical protein
LEGWTAAEAEAEAEADAEAERRARTTEAAMWEVLWAVEEEAEAWADEGPPEGRVLLAGAEGATAANVAAGFEAPAPLVGESFPQPSNPSSSPQPPPPPPPPRGGTGGGGGGIHAQRRQRSVGGGERGGQPSGDDAETAVGGGARD